MSTAFRVLTALGKGRGWEITSHLPQMNNSEVLSHLQREVGM